MPPEQIERMLATLTRQRDYLARLCERMRVKRFPGDDPIYRAALGAYEKASNLCVVVASARNQHDDGSVMARKPWGGEG